MGTCTECGLEKELKDRTICEACRKRIQRAKKVGVSASGSVGESPSSASSTPRAEQQPTIDVVSTPGKPHPAYKESPEECLARRVKETGSKKWQWVKTGNPPGSGADIKVPQKWELSDIDKAMEYRGQWGEREL